MYICGSGTVDSSSIGMLPAFGGGVYIHVRPRYIYVCV